QAFVYLESFPLTATGKIDRKALPAPSEYGLLVEYVAPRNRDEKLLAEVWAEILQLDKNKISVFDSFFQLGGHCLIATQMVARLKSRLQLEIPLRQIFEKPKLIDLAQSIEECRLTLAKSSKPPLKA